MKTFKSPFFIALSAVVIVLIPVVIYFSHFNHLYLSDKGEDWASFGSFMSPFISISSLILLGYLSFRLYKIEQNRDWTLLEIKKIRPLIVIENIGVGPAKNIIIKSDGVVERIETRPVLLAGQTLELDWGINEYCNLEVLYYNVHEVKSICTPKHGLDGYVSYSTKAELIAVFGNPLEKMKLKFSKLFHQ
jgi:hypothetical protein